jgi:hypothetical protein
MKELTLQTILLLLHLASQSQNLVANPSFENVNYCEVKVPCSPSAWFSVTNYPSGYQNNVPKAFSGKYSLGFLIAYRKELRSYWQTMLLCNLQEGKTYTLEFKVYSPDSEFNPSYFGAQLGDSIFKSADDTLIHLDKYQHFDSGKLRPLRNRWIAVSMPIVATGKEKYLLFGNFDQHSNEQILRTNKTHVKYIEYYIDDVSLKGTDKSFAKCLSYDLRLDSLFAANIRHAGFEMVKATESFNVSRTPIINLKADTITLGKINFNFNSAELINIEHLKTYFDNLRASEITKIEIFGYTDTIGSKPYNLNLSQKRALSVKKYLTDTLNLSEKIIFATGKGVINDNSILKNNRRVEVVITRK